MSCGHVGGDRYLDVAGFDLFDQFGNALAADGAGMMYRPVGYGHQFGGLGHGQISLQICRLIGFAVTAVFYCGDFFRHHRPLAFRQVVVVILTGRSARPEDAPGTGPVRPSPGGTRPGRASTSCYVQSSNTTDRVNDGGC